MIPQKMGSRTSPGGRRFYVNHFKCWTLQFGIASCFCCTTLAVGTSWKVIHILALKLSESDSSRPPPQKKYWVLGLFQALRLFFGLVAADGPYFGDLILWIFAGNFGQKSLLRKGLGMDQKTGIFHCTKK